MASHNGVAASNQEGSQLSSELRLHLIECSMKDACDLVNALMVNLGTAELALAKPAPKSRKESASKLLHTCQQLTMLLAGAVQIARRDACSDLPKPRNLAVSDLVHSIATYLRTRYQLDGDSVGFSNMSDVTVCVDPQIAMDVVERLANATSPLLVSPTAKFDADYNGANVTFSICWQGSIATIESEGPSDARLVRPTRSLQLDSKYLETIATCRALLARQDSSLDFGLDADGNLEIAIVLPAYGKNVVQFRGASVVGTPVAGQNPEELIPAHANDEAGRKRSGKMIVQSDRFGSIDVNAPDILSFPRGIIGFADETGFVLVRTGNASAVGWLQSVATPYMALPVVSAHVLVPKYPDVDIVSYAEVAGLGQSLDELAVLVVLNAPPGIPATVNLVAPIIVNAVTRKGAQLLLEGSRFTTREIFMLPPKQDTAAPSDLQSATSAAE
jgi:flagellar assembly factor FliW